jgi:hypothetical protein
MGTKTRCRLQATSRKKKFSGKRENNRKRHFGFQSAVTKQLCAKVARTNIDLEKNISGMEDGGWEIRQTQQKRELGRDYVFVQHA